MRYGNSVCVKRMMTHFRQLFLLFLSLVLCCVTSVVDFHMNITVPKKESDWFKMSSRKQCHARWGNLIRKKGRHSSKVGNDENNAAEFVHGNNKKKILYVHVGKTGGQTIFGYYLKNFTNFHPQQLHVHALDIEMVRSFKTILISVRDPVDRLISAYYYSNPLIKGSFAHDHNQRVNEFYSCCPTLTDFGNALFDKKNESCYALARSQTNLQKNHMVLDTCAYLSGVFSHLKVKKNRVFLINTESITADLNKISRLNQWRVNFNDSNTYVANASPRPSRESETSEKTYQQLLSYLNITGELDMYNRLQNEFGWKAKSGKV